VGRASAALPPPGDSMVAVPARVGLRAEGRAE
jgi:hypothetical protein